MKKLLSAAFLLSSMNIMASVAFCDLSLNRNNETIDKFQGPIALKNSGTSSRQLLLNDSKYSIYFVSEPASTFISFQEGEKVPNLAYQQLKLPFAGEPEATVKVSEVNMKLDDYSVAGQCWTGTFSILLQKSEQETINYKVHEGSRNKMKEKKDEKVLEKNKSNVAPN